jgi:hypothetical protein
MLPVFIRQHFDAARFGLASTDVVNKNIQAAPFFLKMSRDGLNIFDRSIVGF